MENCPRCNTTLSNISSCICRCDNKECVAKDVELHRGVDGKWLPRGEFIERRKAEGEL